MSTLLERLSRRFYRTLDPREQARITADIDYLMAQTTCYCCGEPIEPGSACFNVSCSEGRENIDWETADHQYHAGSDYRGGQWEVDL